MADTRIKTELSVDVKIILELTLSEARALKAMTLQATSEIR